ncbi:MAG: hypothetical protein MK132_08125 [Lentisphaerales bacterium]|nr:hypothetical protein [Lentisphaerales bacterium]
MGSFAPHCMVLDINMRDTNGLEVLQFMSENESYNKVKVILNSGLPKGHRKLEKAFE